MVKMPVIATSHTLPPQVAALSPYKTTPSPALRRADGTKNGWTYPVDILRAYVSWQWVLNLNPYEGLKPVRRQSANTM